MIRAVVFDCDGVLSDNGSSWEMIHKKFGTGSDDGGDYDYDYAWNHVLCLISHDS